MDKTAKALLIALGGILLPAVGMNFINKVINDVAEISEAKERQKKEGEFAFRARIECHKDRRELRQIEEQRIATKEFQRYSQSIWEGTKLHQTEPRTAQLESLDECMKRLREP